jgi:hypothetical protein
MAKEDITDLMKFLEPFPAHIRETALWMREFVWDLYPKANELIYDNYNALAFGWSPTEKQGHIFCSVAAYRSGKNLHFGFYWGSQIKDPKKLLLGEGNQYRYLLITKKEDLPKTYVKQLLKEAYANSLMKVKDPGQIVHGKTITKSISAAKRRTK